MEGRTTPNKERPPSPFVSPSYFSRLPDNELISQCRENIRPAWDEFFKRNIPFIKKNIKKRLFEYGVDPDKSSGDPLWDIHEQVVIKLYHQGALSHCTDTEGIHPWLAIVVKNQVIDWVKTHNRNKRLPQQQTENTMAYLSAPLQSESHITLEDILSEDITSAADLADELELLLNKIENLEDEKKKWIIRLSLISLWPLTQEDVENLAVFRQSPVQEVDRKINAILTRLDEKNKKKAEDMGRAVILWHELSRLEYRLGELERSSGQQSEQLQLQHEIVKKKKRRETLIKSAQNPIRPSNQEIAEIVGVAEENCEQISTLLTRIRKQLIAE